MNNSSLFRNGALVSKGNDGESAALHWLRFTYPNKRIDDLRASLQYQQHEIDFRVDNRLTFEVKSDVHIARTQNVVFELCRIHHASLSHCAYLGWSVFSEADSVLIWNRPTLTLYELKTTDLRAGMQQYVNEYHEKANIRPVFSDDLRTTVNVMTPLRYIQHTRHLWTGKTWLNLGQQS